MRYRCPKSVKRTIVGIDSARVYSNTNPTQNKKYQKLLLFFCLSSLAFIGLSTTCMAFGMEPNSPDSTDTIFPCGKCHSPVTLTKKAFNAKPVISGTMHPVREFVISNMITLQTQSAPGTAPSAIVQTILSFLLKI